MKTLIFLKLNALKSLEIAVKTDAMNIAEAIMNQWREGLFVDMSWRS